MKKCLAVILLSLLSLAGLRLDAALDVNTPDVEAALEDVDKELDRRDIYLKRRSSRIDSLNRLITELPRRDVRRLDLILQLGDCYAGYLTDSAIVNYERGEALSYRLGELDKSMEFKLKRIAVLPVAGLGAMAVEMYEDIPIDSLSHDLRVVALEAGRQMYSYQASFFVSYRDEYDRWLDKSIDIQRQLLEELPEGSEKYQFNQGEYFYLTGRPSEAKAVLHDLLDSIPGNTNIAARASHIMSMISKNRGDTDSQIYYLAKSAVADIQSATREMVSLQELGIALYDRQETARAYEYLSVALAYAVDCHASMRILQTSEALPVISAAYRDSLALSRRRLYFAIGAMALMLVAVITILIKLRKEMAHMEKLQMVLANANRVKEMYMSQFLNLCTIYMNKLNQFCKIAERKISTGHADDLYKMTKSGRFVEEQSQEFYDTFDKAFLHIYPTFVADVNALFKPEEKIVLKEGELMNTDLRILAFMRLGVEESTRIAQVLNYSVHTIYAYRNRLKNRAIDRDNFESEIMKIGSLS